MPELPDLTVYVERLSELTVGHTIENITVGSPGLLRTFDPPLSACEGTAVVGVSRMGKRVVFALDTDLFIVVHLMIAGRFRWRKPGAALPKRAGIAAFGFGSGTLLLTESGSKKRASLYVERGAEDLSKHDRKGLEPLECSFKEFKARLKEGNHTLKRLLTDPRLFAGIGNAYSDEILHFAGLSPVALTKKMSDEQQAELYSAMRDTLGLWTEKLRKEAGDSLPEKVTAFREGMAVHGRYGAPCPRCEAPVQRIVYAGNEANYCAQCQTGGKLLADRALSRVLKSDWPKSLEELESMKAEHRRRASGG